MQLLEPRSLFKWDRDKADIRSRLRARGHDLRLILKTRDDPFYLERWIQHHAKVVGLDGLVIFDNLSTSEAVLRVYDTYPDVLVIQFADHHNSLHDVSNHLELYDALQESSEWFALLDTDEFLLLFDHDTFRHDRAVIDFLRAQGEADFAPSTCLVTAPNTDRVAQVGTDVAVLRRGLKWGKPLIRTGAPIQGFICHNCQYATANSARASGSYSTRLILLHLLNAIPEQRIPANVRKLLALRRLKKHETDADLHAAIDDLVASLALCGVTADASGKSAVWELDAMKTALERFPKRLLRPNRRSWIRQMLEAVSQMAMGSSVELSAGQIRWRPDGRVDYFSDLERALLHGFVGPDGDRTSRDVLGLRPASLC